MKRVLMLRFLFVLLLAMLMGCSETSTEPEDEEPVTVASEEAKLIAMCLSDSLGPPAALSLRVENDLVKIRDCYGSTYQVVDAVRFTTPWEPSAIMIKFDEATAQLVLQGDYHAWDGLNEELGIAEIEEELLSSIGIATVHFEGIINPRRVVGVYASLPGVERVDPNYRVGDWSCIYPRLVEDQITYLFREGWGDCPAGCTYDRYWYFVFVEGQPTLIGVWCPHEAPWVPGWWGEAWQNRELYWSWQVPLRHARPRSSAGGTSAKPGGSG